jgi:DNA-binding NarL/FixJ family response regulator
VTTDPARDLRLVLVEDDLRVRSALESTFAVVPGVHLLASCADFAAARVQVRRLRPDVVLVDVLLPGVAAGLALLGELAAAGIPAVAMSASGGVRTRALAAGAHAFVEKDGSAEALVDAVLAAGRGGTSPRAGAT